MGILDGKRLLITGVITDDSLAFGVARYAQVQGAEIVLTGAGRGMSLTERTSKKLPDPPDVMELDVTVPEHFEIVRTELDRRWGSLDGALHAIGFAPPSCLGGGFMEAPWEDVAVAMQISTFSLKELTRQMMPLFEAAGGGSVVGLDFDATVAWPVYDWMGVAKAGLESCTRYLAKYCGDKNVRVNLVAAGPIKTLAGKSIPGFEQFEHQWTNYAPLGWDVHDTDPVARAACALFSDLFPATTGEVLHLSLIHI